MNRRCFWSSSRLIMDGGGRRCDEVRDQRRRREESAKRAVKPLCSHRVNFVLWKGLKATLQLPSPFPLLLNRWLQREETPRIITSRKNVAHDVWFVKSPSSTTPAAHHHHHHTCPPPPPRIRKARFMFNFRQRIHDPETLPTSNSTPVTLTLPT